MTQALVLDGAAGTYMESKNTKLHPKLWSSGSLLTPEGHELVRDLHKAYIEAGADVITTVTYQASIPGLIAAGVSEIESSELISRAVIIAREEADKVKKERKVLVAGGLGPYGAYLSNGEEYTGNYGSATTYETLSNYWIPRVKAILVGSPDVLLFETIPNVTELTVIVNEITPLAVVAEIPVWISFSLSIPSSTKQEITLADGTPLSDVAKLFNSNKCHIQMVGANCFDVRYASRVIDTLNQLNLPIIIYPNSGEIYDGIQKTWQSVHADDADRLPWHPLEWHTRGVDVIGGCCRTTPGTISKIRSALTNDECF